jgi:phage-related protein
MFIIEYFTTASGRSPVQDFIFEQDQKTKTKILEVVDYLQEFGFHLPTSYLRRMSGTQKLWELRVKYRSKQYRLFLAKWSETTIIMLHIMIKKTQKTPRQEIETAQQRLQSYEKGAS